jgi:serine/threonine protein kinase
MVPQLRNIGKFEIIRELGRGAMGAVYHAHDPFSNREVAIKIAHREAFEDREHGARFRKMFFNEAKVSSQLKHANIVQVYDAGVEEDTSYIVMEYIAGDRSLHDHTRPNSLLPLEDVVRITFKCARALDYAHRHGVVHRDIKPKNILLTKEFDVKIGDFGIALIVRADATETQVHGYVGSPLYMSPEQIREEEITSQSDIFSLGVVLYEALTGKSPFVADSLPAIIHQITEKPHIPLDEARGNVPDTLCQIIDRTLQKNTADRYKSALDVAADLSRVYDHLKLFNEEVSGREKFNLVRDLAFFNDFSDAEVWEVINASNWLEFEPGDQIISEGDVDNSFYVIISGTVGVTRGSRQVHELGAGDCFGEMGVIAGKERTASIVAKTRVTALMIRASLIERSSLHCQLRFHKVFLTTLVERLSATTRRISS